MGSGARFFSDNFFSCYRIALIYDYKIDLQVEKA